MRRTVAFLAHPPLTHAKSEPARMHQRHRHADHDVRTDVEVGTRPLAKGEDPSCGPRTAVRRVVVRRKRKTRHQWRSRDFRRPFAASLVLLLVCLILWTIGWRRRRTAVFERSLVPTDPIHISPDIKVSVVIMNHSRPRMVRESNLVQTLAAHDSIDEILLCHSNPVTAFEYPHDKVRNLNATEANERMGLSLRFHYCSTARNDWVIHVDDDQELSSDAINQLISTFARNPHRVVGKFGRAYHYWKAPQRHGYDTKNVLGPSEVILTKFMIVERKVCESFFQYQHVVQDMVSESRPLWNGEDIFLSLTANHVYNVPLQGPYGNLALPLDVWEASDSFKDDDTGAHDVSGNMDRHRIWNVGLVNWWNAFYRAQCHAAYRGRLWYTAKQRLAAIEDTTLS